VEALKIKKWQDARAYWP